MQVEAAAAAAVAGAAKEGAGAGSEAIELLRLESLAYYYARSLEIERRVGCACLPVVWCVLECMDRVKPGRPIDRLIDEQSVSFCKVSIDSWSQSITSHTSRSNESKAFSISPAFFLALEN
jgi:hypothetical protein